MISGLSEKRFEDIFCQGLTDSGYTELKSEQYIKEWSIYVDELILFLEATQKDAWEKFKKSCLDSTNIKINGILTPTEIYKRKLANLLNESVDNYGMLETLRKGIRDKNDKTKKHFELSYLIEPSTQLSKSNNNYHKNRLAFCRQFRYSLTNNNSIDLVIILNGIPLIAFELKNQLTGQNVQDAVEQFKNDRDPDEYCFLFNKRFIVYFAMDIDEVYMATKLAGKNTHFIPFNQGSNGAGADGLKGNPKTVSGYNTEYMWIEILQKHTLFNLLQKYTQIIEENKIVFPRYHQYDVVNKLMIASSLTGYKFLLQHSPGSGKSYSIAWLAYRLADMAMFDRVIVITNRKILNSQLVKTILSLGHDLQSVTDIQEDKDSKYLKGVLNGGKVTDKSGNTKIDNGKIVITTIQKFLAIYKDIESAKGKKFAVIIDEVHNGYTGKSEQTMKNSLTDIEQTYSELTDEQKEEISKFEEFEDTVLSHGVAKNLNIYAFTATPTNRVMRSYGNLVGTQYVPFHVYSMNQAIDEGFILSTIDNIYFHNIDSSVTKTTKGNPTINLSQLNKRLQRQYLIDDINIAVKSERIITKFRENIRPELNGQGKAMVVCESRMQALKMFIGIKKYARENGIQDVNVLLAFSGTLKPTNAEVSHKELCRYIQGTKADNQCKTAQEFIEVSHGDLNKGIDGSNIGDQNKIKQEFKRKEYGLLIVADMFLVGFDEPYLVGMFVDKTLSGVVLVQALSRLNRCLKIGDMEKDKVYVYDYVNKAEDYTKAFEPYQYTTRLVKNEVDNLAELLTVIYKYKLFDTVIANVYFTLICKENKSYDKQISDILNAINDKFNKLSQRDKFGFQTSIRSYTNEYFWKIGNEIMLDIDIHALGHLCDALEKRLKSSDVSEADKANLNRLIDVNKVILTENEKTSIAIGEYTPRKEASLRKTESMEELHKKALDDMIDKFNKKLVSSLGQDITKLEELCVEHPTLNGCVGGDVPEKQFERKFKEVFGSIISNNQRSLSAGFNKKIIQGRSSDYKLFMSEMSRHVYNVLKNKKDYRNYL